MKSINKILAGASIVLCSTLAYAETPEQAFWNSEEVVARVARVKNAGFTKTKGEPVVVLKHEFRGPYGVVERSFLVTQVFAPERFAYSKATSITAIVKQNSLGEMIDVEVVELPKAMPNDFNGGSDEN